MGYYQLYDYISNSNLKALNDALRLKEKPDNIQDIFDFGNLFDASITEKDKINGNVLSDEASGRVIEFDSDKITLAANMAVVIEQDPLFTTIFENAKTQYVVMRNAFEVEHNGVFASLPVRCKFDILRRGVIGGDLKTTSCTSQKSFIASIDHFDYDQQAAFYMDLARVDRFIFFGVSKKTVRGKHQVFKYAINRGDDMYNSGKRKYSRLAVLYHYLILNINFDLTKINI